MFPVSGSIAHAVYVWASDNQPITNNLSSHPPAGGNIFELDKVAFPINRVNIHWVGVVVYMQEQRIQFYDSLFGNGNDYIWLILRYLCDEFRTQYGKELPINAWTVVFETPPMTPRQKNGYDCGAFVCMYLHFLLLGLPLVFVEEDIDQFRMLMAASILKNRMVV